MGQPECLGLYHQGVLLDAGPSRDPPNLQQVDTGGPPQLWEQTDSGVLQGVLARPLSSSVISSKFLDLSEPKFCLLDVNAAL